MNRIVGRSKFLLVLVMALALGTSFFLGEYVANSKTWVHAAGSPHIYDAGQLGCGTIVDSNGVLLMDMSENRTYSQSEDLRKAVLHWLGDRQGNISAPAMNHYAEELAGFDPISGVYAYGGIGGQATLTLSGKLQMAALEAMGDYVGTVAVINYKTGEILCAVTTPTFDPDNLPDITGDSTGAYSGVYVNRFTQATYTPGSIFKIVTTAAALECLPDILNETFTCTGRVEYGIDKVTCEQSHGTLTLKEAFARSCNCAFAQLSERIGGKRLQEYAKHFGILDSVAFDGITTAKGSMASSGAADVSVAWSAIGQHKDLINPCGYLRFMAAIANEGVQTEPYLVSQITCGNKTTYQAQTETGQRILSVETATTLQSFLRNNVENYYGEAELPEGMNVCGKSGTGEVGGGKKPNAMFTGFVENEDYPLAFIVCVEDGGYGRPVCMPILGKVLTTCKEILDS